MTRFNDPTLRGLRLAMIAGLAFASHAYALPVELKDSNGTRYYVNTQVVPLSSYSNASGALTNATFEKAVTVTNYYIGITPWFGFLTTYTTQHQVNVPLTPPSTASTGSSSPP